MAGGARGGGGLPPDRLGQDPEVQTAGTAAREGLTTMDFGLHLGTVNPRLWADVAEAGDRLGFESVWVPEHLVVPFESSGSPHHWADHPPIPPTVPIFDALG